VTNEPLLEGDFLDRAGYVLGNFGGRDNAGAILIAQELNRVGDLLEMLVAAQQEKTIREMVDDV
jgi:hypothetical protein